MANPSDFSLDNLMKEAEKMQKRMQDAQKTLSELRITGEAAAGMVKVEMNGKHDVLSITIHPSLMEEGHDMLGEVIAAAVNDAVRKVEKESQKKIAELTAGLNLPNTLTGKLGEDKA